VSTKSVVAILASVLALSSASAALGAVPGSRTFTVLGTESSQTLLIDRNGNGQVDPGDAFVITGPLTDAFGSVIGDWRANLFFVRPHTGYARALFRFWGGGLLVRGTFDPEAGPPPFLEVYGGFGSFRGTAGSVSVSDTQTGGSAFTFTIRPAAPWHP
jgi:hypothetical protein